MFYCFKTKAFNFFKHVWKLTFDSLTFYHCLYFLDLYFFFLSSCCFLFFSIFLLAFFLNSFPFIFILFSILCLLFPFPLIYFSLFSWFFNFLLPFISLTILSLFTILIYLFSSPFYPICSVISSILILINFSCIYVYFFIYLFFICFYIFSNLLLPFPSYSPNLFISFFLFSYLFLLHLVLTLQFLSLLTVVLVWNSFSICFIIFPKLLFNFLSSYFLFFIILFFAPFMFFRTFWYIPIFLSTCPFFLCILHSYINFL